jgi:hypothetical protein
MIRVLARTRNSLQPLSRCIFGMPVPGRAFLFGFRLARSSNSLFLDSGPLVFRSSAQAKLPGLRLESLNLLLIID